MIFAVPVRSLTKLWWCLTVGLGLLTATCHDGWSPVVSQSEDVDAMPVSERSIRCINCNDEVLNAIGHRFQNLEFLYINTQSKVTDQGIAVLSRLPRLLQLEVTNASMLTDSSIPMLKQLSSLRELSLDGATKVSDKALISLTTNSKIDRLFLLNFPRISSDTVQKMREQLPECNIRIE
jgi:hypothetical protein